MTSQYLLLTCAPMFGLLLWAAAEDLRSRTIPNWLSFSIIIGGFAQSFLPHATVSPTDSLLGFGTGFGLTFFIFALGALGGGDVKLLAGVGAWLGPAGALAVFCVEAIVGLVIVVSQAVAQGRMKTLLRNSTVVAINLVHVGDVGVDHVSQTGQSCRSVERPLPFAVPVLLAALAVVALA